MGKKAVEPLNEYIKKFDKYKKVLNLNPEEYVAKFDVEGAEKPVDFLLAEVAKFEKEEKSLENNIKSVVHVSFFRVDSKDIIKTLSKIYNNVQKQLIEWIAKRAKNQTVEIYDKYKEIDADLRKIP